MSPPAWLRKMARFIWPESCAGCGRILPLASEEICRDCLARLRPAPEEMHPAGAPSLDRLRSGFLYEEPLRSAIHRWKYEGRTGLTPFFARLLTERAGDFLAGIHALVFIPGHSRDEGRRSRGSELLAAAVGKAAGLPVRPLLRKIRPTPAQISLSGEARRRNLVGAFALAEGVGDVAGAAFCLVDDVATTLTTLEEAARPLRAAGAERVIGLALARTPAGLE